MYQAFKENLLQEFAEKRDLAVISTLRSKRESLFGLRTDNDKIYSSILNAFETITLKQTRKLVLDLCLKHNIPACDGKEMLHDITINKDNQRRHYVLLNKIESINSEQFYMLSESIRYSNEPCTLVFLLKDTVENKTALKRVEDRFYMRFNFGEEFPQLFSCTLFEDFLLNTFGEEEAEDFNTILADIKTEFYNILGYQISEICNPYNLSKLRGELLDELKTFPYESIRQKTFLELKMNSDINDPSFQRIRRNFINGNKYELLIKEGNFAKSFLTSEWLYKKYVMLEQLDNTFIVAGYLKSVEQLLWNIIKLTGKGKFINGKKIGTAKDDKIDTTLGSLEHFIIDSANNDLFIDAFARNSFVILYIKKQISAWREKKRNGLFHKNQLKDKAKIESIREETIFLYFLILGSLKLTDDQVKMLEK